MDLIIDTSSEKLSVLLNDEKDLIKSEESDTKHLKHLLPEIEKILNFAGKDLKDVDCFGVVLGPGSFTGVRIGVSTVKAFCEVFNKKIIGINLLELLAFSIIRNLNLKNDFCVLIKSTSVKYYFATFSSNGKMKESKLIKIEDLKEYLEKNKIACFCYNFKFDDIPSSNIDLIPKDYIDFVDMKKEKNEYIEKNELKPIYLALSQAEEELLRKESNNA